MVFGKCVVFGNSTDRRNSSLSGKSRYRQDTYKTREFKSKKIYIFQHISFYEQLKSFNNRLSAEDLFLSGFRYTRHFRLLVFVKRREGGRRIIIL